ncbi:MAG TPA: hypothetical protein VFQ51_03880, partial [Vicinamibacteria bacterium]|nr:hypothetical protein [Vicinamibacteria bacterium]
MKAALALLAVTLAPYEPPRALVTVSKTEVGVGETFRVELKAFGPAGTEWTFPAEAGNDDVELRTPAVAAGATPEPLAPGTHRYEGAAFALGEP